VLSCRRLCDMLITHPEDSYRLWCVISSAKKNRNVIAWDQITKSGSKNEPGSYVCYHSVFYVSLPVDVMNKGISFKLSVSFCHYVIWVAFVWCKG